MKLTKAIIGVALIAPSIVLAQKVDMKLNLEKGKKYTLTTEVENTTKNTMMGQVTEYSTSQSATTHVELTEDNGKSDTYKIWYGNVDMSMTGMGQTQSFSSDTASLEAVDPMSKVLASLTDKKFDAKISEKGLVEEVMGLEEMVKSATLNMPGGEAVASQISGSLGDDGFAKNLEMMTDIFPEKPVKVGSSWTKEQFTATGLPIIANTTYTLKSIDQGTALVNVNAKLTTDSKNATTEVQGMQATLYYDGERTGTLNVDVATGWVTSGNLKDDLVGSITIAPGAQIPDGMTIPTEVSNIITISN